MMNEQREIRDSRGGAMPSCWGKVRFEPHRRDLARQVASRMAKSKHTRMETFRCPHCDGWHIGQSMGLR
jgi:hypothetical protein